ncbi:MAG: MOSC domain-containing protein [Actinomycetota bacterium]
MATVARFNVAPVKSTSLQHPDAIDLGRNGVEADRRFLFIGVDGKRISGGGKVALLGIRSTFDEDGDRLTLELPDGTRAEGDAAPAGEEIHVTLFDREVGARRVPGPFDAAVSRLLDRDVMLVRVEHPERSGGVHPVSIVSSASVEELGRRAERETPDPRRFRMLVELDGCAPHEEDVWTGSRLRMGGAIVRVGAGVPRCVLTTMHPDTGEPDFPALEVLATYRRREGELLFGVYADVEEPGRVRVGDAVEVLGD